MFMPFFFLFSIIKKSLFTKIYDLHLEQIKKINLTDNIVTHLKINSINNNKYCFSNYNFRKILINYSKTNNKEIFHSIFYPSYSFDAPILSINLINFNNSSNSIFLINLVEIYNHREYTNYYIKPFYRIKNIYPQFTQIKSDHIFPSKYINLLNSQYLVSNKLDIYFKKITSTIILLDYLENSNIDLIHYNIIQNFFDTYFKMFTKRPVDRYFIADRHLECEEIIKKITQL